MWVKKNCLALALLAPVFLTDQVAADHISPCLSTFEVNAAALPAPLFACPQGDTDAFIDQGWWIRITARDPGGSPVQWIPPADIWLVDVPPVDITLCNGIYSANADSATNAEGMTSMSLTTLAAGGCVDGLAVVVQGMVLTEATDCVTWRIAPIHMRSPDLDGSLTVDLADLSTFAMHYPPNAYASCCDFTFDGAVDVADLAEFALHYSYPRHRCDS